MKRRAFLSPASQFAKFTSRGAVDLSWIPQPCVYLPKSTHVRSKFTAKHPRFCIHPTEDKPFRVTSIFPHILFIFSLVKVLHVDVIFWVLVVVRALRVICKRCLRRSDRYFWMNQLPSSVQCCLSSAGGDRGIAVQPIMGNEALVQAVGFAT